MSFIYGKLFVKTVIKYLVAGIFFFPHASLHVITSEAHESSFILHGTESHYVKFEGIPPDVSSELTDLTLEYVEFDPIALVKSIAECKNLKRINLHDVEWVGEFNTRAVLPRLEDFSLHRARGLHDIDEETLKGILFFDKSETPWKLSEIYKLKVDIHTELFVIDHIAGSVYASFQLMNDVLKGMIKDPQVKIKNLVLEHMIASLEVFPPSLEFLVLHDVELEGNSSIDSVFQKATNLKGLSIDSMHEVLDIAHLPTNSLESLELNNVHVVQNSPTKFNNLKNITVIACHLDPEFIPETIKSIELDDTFLYGGKINEVLSRIKALEKLTLKRSTPSKIDISYIPGKLTELHIENMNLELNDVSSIKTFQNLKKFTCQDCTMDKNIIQNFSTLFKQVEYFDLWFRCMETPNHQLLTAIIQGTMARRIEMLDFNRTPANMDDKAKENFQIAEKFLDQIGFPKNDTVFILEKNSKNGKWRYSHPWDADTDFSNHHSKIF